MREIGGFQLLGLIWIDYVDASTCDGAICFDLHGTDDALLELVKLIGVGEDIHVKHSLFENQFAARTLRQVINLLKEKGSTSLGEEFAEKYNFSVSRVNSDQSDSEVGFVSIQISLESQPLEEENLDALLCINQ